MRHFAFKKSKIIIHNKRFTTRLGIDEKDWINHIRYFERQFPTVAGNIDKLRELAEQTSRKWIKGMGCAFNPAPS